MSSRKAAFEQTDFSALPLYGLKVQPQRKQEGHAGLWFDKFCNTWHRGSDAWTMTAGDNDGDGNPKLNWLNTLTGEAVGSAAQIDEAVLRLFRLTEGRGGHLQAFASTSRFVTGLGRSHPVENGFAWHPALGTPYLPGSSAKGLVLVWARVDAEPKPDTETVDRLLGTPGKAGAICFLDALPMKPVKLETDVMTPHYAAWDVQSPPGDWLSPTPIPFLVTCTDTRFLFGFAPRTGVTLEQDDSATVSGWLKSALEWGGAGAKTAVGYGRFQRDEAATNALRSKASKQRTLNTPMGRWQSKLESLTEEVVLDHVRVNLMPGTGQLQDPGERRTFAEAVLALGFLTYWGKGNKRNPRTSVGSRKLKERARWVRAELSGADG